MNNGNSNENPNQMAALTPIPGDDVRVGDVVWGRPDRRTKVTRMTLDPHIGYPQRPMLEVHGVTEFFESPSRLKSTTWTEVFFGNSWVVVER